MKILQLIKRIFCRHQWVMIHWVEHAPTSYGTFAYKLKLVKVCKKCGKIHYGGK